MIHTTKIITLTMMVNKIIPSNPNNHLNSPNNTNNNNHNSNNNNTYNNNNSSNNMRVILLLDYDLDS